MTTAKMKSYHFFRSSGARSLKLQVCPANRKETVNQTEPSACKWTIRGYQQNPVA